MRGHILVMLGTAAATFSGAGGAASAEQPADGGASCVALITSYEATQLGPGFVGSEVSGLAASGRAFGQTLVSPLAQKHLGSIERCSEAEA
jgi:hypothetical protein